jgi:DNA-directed RNA polymerase specialized sigma24 family protein
MKGLLTSYANASAARNRAVLREQITHAARHLLFVELRRHGLQEADADDAANGGLLKVLDSLLADPAMADPEAYVRRAAKHLWIDVQRHRGSRAYMAPVDVQAPALAERLAVKDSAKEEQDKDLLRCLEEILARPDSPVNYVCILDAHYLWEIPIEVITCHELWQRSIQPPGTLQEQKKARNSVDQRLTRARKWLQREAEQCCQEALS